MKRTLFFKLLLLVPALAPHANALTATTATGKSPNGTAIYQVSVTESTYEKDSNGISTKDLYTYTVTNQTNTPFCDFHIKFFGKVGGKASDLVKDTTVPMAAGLAGWDVELKDDEAIFTAKPGQCIGTGAPGNSAAFGIVVPASSFSVNGVVETSVSTRNAGKDTTVGRTSILGGQPLWGPSLVSITPSSTENTAPPFGLNLVGVVVDGDKVTFSTAGKAAIEGQVLDVNGQKVTTGPGGYVTMAVPAGATALLVTGTGPAASVHAFARVISKQAGSSAAPSIDTATAYASPGGELEISGKNLSGNAADNKVTIGQTSLPVTSSSSAAVLATVPVNTPVGETAPLIVATPGGKSTPRKVAIVSLQVQGNKTTLLKGQKGNGSVIVKGTSDKVQVRITNASQGVVQLAGGQTATTTTSSGGNNNVARIPYTAVGAGAFVLNAEILQPATTSSKQK